MNQRFKQVVLASNNPGKLTEFRALLGPLQIEVIAQQDLKIPAAEEPFDTFVENALPVSFIIITSAEQDLRFSQVK